MGKADTVLIGLGKWGSNYLRSLIKLKKLYAVFDPKFKSNKIKTNFIKTYSSYPIKIIDDFNDLLNDSKIRNCIIATPPETHYEILIKCLSSKKNVLIEKPLFIKKTNFEPIYRLIKKNNLTFMVGHLLNYHNGVNKLINYINSRDFGEIKYIISQRLNLGRFRKEENIISSFAPHDISLILRISKSFPKKIKSSNFKITNNTNYDISNSLISFKDFNAYINVSWIHPEKIHKFLVYSNKKMIEFNNILDRENKLRLVEIPKFEYHFNENIKLKEKFIKYSKTEPLLNQMKHFFECVKHSSKPLTDINEAKNVHQVMMKMINER